MLTHTPEGGLACDIGGDARRDVNFHFSLRECDGMQIMRSEIIVFDECLDFEPFIIRLLIDRWTKVLNQFTWWRNGLR